MLIHSVKSRNSAFAAACLAVAGAVAGAGISDRAAAAENANVILPSALPALIDPDLATMGGDLARGVKTPFDATYMYCGVYSAPQDGGDTLVAMFRGVERHMFHGKVSETGYNLPLNMHSLQKAAALGLHVQAADALHDVKAMYNRLREQPAAPRPPALYKAICAAAI